MPFEFDEAWRGAAMNVWHAGADGVYTFNLFPNRRVQRFDQLGSPETLRGLDKIYAVEHLTKFTLGGQHRMANCVEGRLPVEVSTATPSQIHLPVGEDIVANAPAEKTAHAKLELKLRPMAAGDQITVGINGTILGEAIPRGPLTAEPGTHWVDWKPDPKLFKPGDNLVEVQLKTKRELEEPMVLQCLLLRVRYE